MSAAEQAMNYDLAIDIINLMKMFSNDFGYFFIGAFKSDTIDLEKGQHYMHSDALVSIKK